MKRIFCALTLGLSTLCTLNSSAQCPAGRYVTEMFPYTMSTVTYSTPYSLQMDIYQPSGDAMAARPLIILGHGGSFIGGTKSDDATVDSLCVRFAERGYVTASIDYRLGDLFSMIADSSVAIDVVMKAISDGKAAVRYFMQDAATTNTYKIDTNYIFVGGNSAGAVLYMHVGYLDSAEAPGYITTAMAANGGFEGNSGNPGYTTKTRAVINLAGALNSASFVDAGDVPSVNAQGSADATVPYNCAYPLSGSVHVNLCGLGVLESAYTSNSIYHWSKVFSGDGHVPWTSSTAKFNTVDSLVREFLYTIVCPGGAAVSNVKSNGTLNVYPNPASNVVNVQSDIAIAEIAVYDQVGRAVITTHGNGKKQMEVNTSMLPRGIYFVRVQFAAEGATTLVRRLTIE
jgi:para-nitrobenzyl esterase